MNQAPDHQATPARSKTTTGWRIAAVLVLISGIAAGRLDAAHAIAHSTLPWAIAMAVAALMTTVVAGWRPWATILGCLLMPLFASVLLQPAGGAAPGMAPVGALLAAWATLLSGLPTASGVRFLRIVAAVALILWLLIAAYAGGIAGAQSVSLAAYAVVAAVALAATTKVETNAFAAFTAAAAAGTALLVAIGWWTGNSIIVQAATNYVPMQFNTAVIMFCLAAAFWLSLHRRRRYSLLPLIPVFVLALATLIEEFAGAALGVGDWLLSHPIVAEQVQPGRMAPNTAIGALLVAIGVLAMPADRDEHPARAATTWLCGFATSVLASFVLAGYLLELPVMRSWGGTTPMALLTALCLMLLGLALATLRLETGSPSRGRPVWGPLLIGLAGVLLIFTAWVSAQRSSQRSARLELQRQVVAAVDSAADRTRERTNTLKRVGLRALDAADASERQRGFRRDAHNYLQDYYVIEAMALVPPDGGPADVVARDDAKADCLRRRLQQADWTSMVDTCNGESLLLSRVIAQRGEQRVVLAAIYALTPILVRQLAALNMAIPVKLKVADHIVYQRGIGDGPAVVRRIALDHALNATIEAQLSAGSEQSHAALTGFLLIGTLACALLALSLRLSGLARERFVVAERRQSELETQSQTLKRLQTDLMRAHEIAGLGHWAYDPGADTLEWSEALNHVFGLAPGTSPIRFDDVAALVDGADRARWRSAHADTLLGLGDLVLDYRSTAPDGTVRRLHERARLLRRADGSPWLVTATVQDVTERERLAQAVGENEERFRLIARATADALWDWDIVADRIWYSEGMQTMFGIDAGYHDSNVASWSSHLHPADRERVMASIDAAVLGEINAWESDYRFLGRGGHYLHVHDRGFVLRDSSGRAIRMVGGMSDVTAQREMQHRQERINAALRLLSGCSDAIFAADDETWLLQEVCRLASGDGHYPLAWIGYALDDLSRTIRPMAVQGAAASLILDQAAAFRWAGVDPGTAGAPGRAIHGAVPVVVRDVSQIGDDWAAHALAAGIHSAICLPLQSRERVFGVIALYGNEPIIAVPPELSILQDLADSLSRGIVALRLRRDQGRLQRAIAGVASTVYGGKDDALFSALLNNLVGALEGRGALLFRFDASSDDRARLLAGVFDGAALRPGECDRRLLPFDDRREQRQFACSWPHRDGPLPDMPAIDADPMLYGIHLNDQDGRAIGALCLLHDRSQEDELVWSTLHVFAARAAAELARVDRERFIREQAALLDKAIEAIFVCDLQGRIRYWNEGAARLFGRGRNDALGRPVAEVVGVDDARARRAFDELRTRREWRDEFPAHPQGGRDISIEAHWSRVSSGRDDAEAVMCIALDVSERHRMLEQLQDSQTRLQSIFDTAAEGIITINTAGCIESANPHALSIFGYARDELTGRNISLLMPEPLASEHDRYISNYLHTGHMALPGTGRELIGRRRDGSTFPVELSVRDVQLASGRLFTGFVRDITARREAEAAMKQLLRDLDSQNQGLQEFVYIASHDLQEPLRKIRVFSDRVLQTEGERLGEQNRDFLTRAIDAARRMQTLIDDLLAYSRVTAKPPTFGKVDLSRIVSEVVDDLTLRLDSSGGRIIVDALPTIDGDATQLRQLFQNLLGNALKYAAADRMPEVRVSAEATDLGGQPAWRIRIEDNGIGFDNRHAEKIFSPFQRLHTRHEYDGSGIGLAIVKRIATRHEGTVTANGLVGAGATFMVVLPASQAARPGGQQAQ